MQGLVIKNGIIRPYVFAGSDDDNANEIHDLIGNTFTTAFRVPGQTSGLSIDGYCDDEFLLRNSVDWNVVLEANTLRQEYYPIGGPIVVIGGNNRTGESRSLTDAEMERFSIDKGFGMITVNGPIPTLRFKPFWEG